MTLMLVDEVAAQVGELAAQSVQLSPPTGYDSLVRVDLPGATGLALEQHLRDRATRLRTMDAVLRALQPIAKAHRFDEVRISTPSQWVRYDFHTIATWVGYAAELVPDVTAFEDRVRVPVDEMLIQCRRSEHGPTYSAVYRTGESALPEATAVRALRHGARLWHGSHVDRRVPHRPQAPQTPAQILEALRASLDVATVEGDALVVWLRGPAACDLDLYLTGGFARHHWHWADGGVGAGPDYGAFVRMINEFNDEFAERCQQASAMNRRALTPVLYLGTHVDETGYRRPATPRIPRWSAPPELT